MAASLKHIGLLALHGSLVLANHLPGTYPPPFDLSSNKSLVLKAWQNFTASFDAYLKDGETEGMVSETLAAVAAENVTFSIGVWSLHDPAATELHYHYASPETLQAVNGTNTVDSDSIYKVASVTKLVTVLAGLLSLTHEQWHKPLREIYPSVAEADSSDNVASIQWDEVTPWSLAQHMSGINSDAIPDINIVKPEYLAARVASGYPSMPTTDLGPCWQLQLVNDFCNIDEWITEISTSVPLFSTYTSPAYSNAGFTTLGAALVNLTGQSIEDLFQIQILGPLNMTSSTTLIPSDEETLARSVVVGDTEIWFAPNGILAPSGGLLSTLNDLNRLGVGVLNSTLLPVEETRKWMKPTTHTSSSSYSFGAPWEIVRYAHPLTGKITDIYSKSGDSGTSGSMLALIPEYGAGFSFLNGAANTSLRSTASSQVLDIVSEMLLPALEAQAAVEAQSNFAGTYRSTDPNLNSSVVISFDESDIGGEAGGLSLSSFVSNGSMLVGGGAPSPRLLPTITAYGSEDVASDGAVAFRYTTIPSYPSYSAGKLGPWSGFYGDWVLGASSSEYFHQPENLLVFNVDEDGMATTVSLAAFRISLKRSEDK